MGALERRIKNLEAALVPDECPVCGYSPPAPILFEVVWEDLESEDREDEPKEPEHCHGCGRQLTYTVTWDGP